MFESVVVTKEKSGRCCDFPLQHWTINCKYSLVNSRILVLSMKGSRGLFYSEIQIRCSSSFENGILGLKPLITFAGILKHDDLSELSAGVNR